MGIERGGGLSGMMGRLARNSCVHAAIAFLGMGTWAVFANHDHPLPQMLAAGLVQGVLSATITLALKRMIEWLAVRFAGIAALALPPLIAVGLSVLLLVTIHSLAGTPEILATIALPVSVTALYSTLYTVALRRPKGKS